MKNNPSDPLTPAEWSVMKAVWKLGRAPSREIYDILHKQHGWANTTVKTLLSKLVQKGFLTYKQDGKRYLYRAKYSSMKMLTQAADAFLEKSLDSDKGQLLCYMVNKADLNETDIEELESMIGEYKKKKGIES